MGKEGLSEGGGIGNMVGMKVGDSVGAFSEGDKEGR